MGVEITEPVLQSVVLGEAATDCGFDPDTLGDWLERHGLEIQRPAALSVGDTAGEASADDEAHRLECRSLIDEIDGWGYGGDHQAPGHHLVSFKTATRITAVLRRASGPVGVTSSDERCAGIEIEPGVYSGCTAAETGATDCPACSGLSGMEAVRERVATAIHNPLGHAMGGTLGALIDAAVEGLEEGGVLADLLPVPSSDEPEGDGQSYANRVVTWAKYVELSEAYGNVSRRERRWLDHLAAIRERLGVRPDSRTLKHILRAIDRLAPVPVGGAEPVAWVIRHEGQNPVSVVHRWLADKAAGAGATVIECVPRGLPVSSQDAGARRDPTDELVHWACPGCGGLCSTPSTETTCECGPCGARPMVQRSLVDLVLPAEGERRGEIVRRAVDLMHGWCTEMDREVVRKLYDALRAAAGKAGSDDAR